MHIQFELNNVSGRKITKPFFGRILRRLEKILPDRYPYPAKAYEVSLAIVTEPEIRKLNRIFRRADHPTDVLSFADFTSRKGILKQKGENVFLGEVILCYDNIKRYSRINGLDLEIEVARVFAHGLLHLFGFRHGKTMFSLQGKASEKRKINKR